MRVQLHDHAAHGSLDQLATIHGLDEVLVDLFKRFDEQLHQFVVLVFRGGLNRTDTKCVPSKQDRQDQYPYTSHHRRLPSANASAAAAWNGNDLPTEYR